jgi:hypothetical protein
VTSSGVPFLELILLAMKAALEHVSAWRPWSFAVLKPPVIASFSFFGFFVSNTAIGLFLTLLVLILVDAVFILRRINELRSFADEFGLRVQEYVNVAVYAPDSLSQYLQVRGGRSREAGSRARG